MTDPIPSLDTAASCECGGDLVTSPTCPACGVWGGQLAADRARSQPPIGLVTAARLPELQVKRIA